MPFNSFTRKYSDQVQHPRRAGALKSHFSLAKVMGKIQHD